MLKRVQTWIGQHPRLSSWLFLAVAGRPFLAEEDALETLRVMSPINSWTVWYAALTGGALKRLEEITPEGAILSWKGQRFHKSVF